MSYRGRLILGLGRGVGGEVLVFGAGMVQVWLRMLHNTDAQTRSSKLLFY